MSFKEATVEGYIETPVKNNTLAAARKGYVRAVNNHNSLYTIGLLIWKHRNHLTAIAAGILVLNWVFPEWFELVTSLI